jgi:hypothetical protein
MQQPLAYIFQTFFQHEIFVITPTLNAGSRCSLHVSHAWQHDNNYCFFNFSYKTVKNKCNLNTFKYRTINF